MTLDFLEQLNWLDVSTLILLGTGAIFGALTGLLWQVARLAAFGVSLYSCLFWHEEVARRLSPYFQSSSPSALSVVSYLIAFLGVYLLLFSVTLLIEKGIKVVKLKPMDRAFGAAFGAAKAGLLVGAVLLGLVLYPNPASEKSLGESRMAPYLLEAMRALIVAVPQEYKNRLSQSLERLRMPGGEPSGRGDMKPGRSSGEGEDRGA